MLNEKKCLSTYQKELCLLFKNQAIFSQIKYFKNKSNTNQILPATIEKIKFYLFKKTASCFIRL